MPTATTAIAAGLAALVLLPVIALASSGAADRACLGNEPPPAGASAADVAWDAEQRRIGAIIVTTGQTKQVPARGIVIALATAMQESSLRNLPGGDADSIGVFQQRPSQGWGTATQLRSPAYQADRFYEALLSVPGWQDMPTTRAAQAVQRSAHPDAYARWARPAAQLAREVAPSLESPTVDSCGSTETLLTSTTPSGATSPAAGIAVTWALAQLGTPYSYGGDCSAPRSGDPRRQCDCSSLVQQAYRAAGVSLPRTTQQQVHAGVPVASLAELQPGDLIFIPGSTGTPEAPGHVGMYIGNGQLVHAPRTGDIIRVAPVNLRSHDVAALRRPVGT
jgi:cell wall-associated NlpC family hydrolase